jgi:hypothetical protein
MISDILFQSVVDLDHYLNDSNFDRTYKGEIRERIIRLRDEAEYIRAILDTHPCDTPPTGASYVSGLQQTGVRPVSMLKTEAAVRK